MSGVRGVRSLLSPLTCQRHQTQRAQISLRLENAGKTSLMAAGVDQAPPLGSVKVLVSQEDTFFMWKYFNSALSKYFLLIVSHSIPHYTCQTGGYRMDS